MRCRHVAVLAVLAGLLTPIPATAAPLRSCGSITGWRVSADRQTTTCQLARSATRDFLRRLGRGEGRPDEIVGKSPKTGKRYRLRLASDRGTQTTSDNTYTGRAGRAVLRVRIRSEIN